MKTPRLNATTCAACVLALAISARAQPIWATSYSVIAGVLGDRCLACHDSDTREGGIDLTPLLEEGKPTSEEHARLWSKVEEKVDRGEMPPEDEEPLTPQEEAAIKQWFHRTFVLRDGKPHIGPTPLRRLTRYELENTLEDILAVPLKVPYRDTITGRIAISKIESIVPSDIPGESGFANDAQRMETLKPPLKEIAVAVHYAMTQFTNDPAALQTVLGRRDLPGDANEKEARQLIAKFMRRAYRGDRQRLAEYTKVYFSLYQKHVGGSEDSRESLRHVFEMILVSPEFLYRLEDSQDLDTPYSITGVELATRLSYFLWSSGPDEELLQLGQDGRLLRDDVLKSQIARMLNSPKRLALAENFAGQWLGFDELLSNSEYLQDERWNRESYDEVLFFFDELLKSDKSFLELVQSDWIYKRASAVGRGRQAYTPIDQESAQRPYADILSLRKSASEDQRVRYDPPVLVETKRDREGGVITSAAIMRLTASKNRTSPIRRGVWVLSTVIGKDLEPPLDVPSLDEARGALKFNRNPSVAEVIQQHVAKPECVSCHKAIDPLGLGLENFAPTGKWRTRYPDDAPVESAGVMPNGKAFQTPQEMKLLLLELYQEDIARNFVEQMFAYALGRKLQPYDRVSLEPMMRKVADDGYRIDTVVEQIVLSRQFRCRQDR